MLRMRRVRFGPGAPELDNFLIFAGDVLAGRIERSVMTADGRPWIWSITSYCRVADPEGLVGSAANSGNAASLDDAKKAFKARWAVWLPD